MIPSSFRRLLDFPYGKVSVRILAVEKPSQNISYTILSTWPQPLQSESSPPTSPDVCWHLQICDRDLWKDRLQKARTETPDDQTEAMAKDNELQILNEDQDAIKSVIFVSLIFLLVLIKLNVCF